jgi:hypothetical protein
MDGMRVLFSAAEIAARVDALAAEIARAIPADFVMSAYSRVRRCLLLTSSVHSTGQAHVPRSSSCG